MPGLKNRLTGLVVVAAIAAEVLLASRARPFTLPAEIVTGVVLLALVGVVIFQCRLGQEVFPIIARRSTVALSGESHAWGLRWMMWIGPLGGLAVWEVFCYLASPRTAHPTMSSMLDTLTASQVGRGSTFILWLILGWYLVTR